MNVDPKTIEQLLGYLTGDLEPDEVSSLEQRMKEDEELRKCLLELSTDEAALTEWAKSERVAMELDDGVFSNEEPCTPKTVRFPGSFFNAPFLAAAAAVVILAIGITAVAIFRSGASQSPGVARLVASTDADWGGDTPDSKLPLVAGQYHLGGGSIDLVFVDGAKVRLSGPTKFELRSARHIHLMAGNLVAQIPDEALGFIVTSPQSEVVDLGTEFGLSVGEGGSTDVHVLDGLVEVLSPNKSSGAPGVLIEAGNALRFGTSPDGQPSEIPVSSRKGLVGTGRFEELGLQMLRGAIRIADSVSQDDLRKSPAGPNRIDLIAEQSGVNLAEALEVTLTEPGSYRDFTGMTHSLPAGTRVTSYLLHFRPGSLEPVFGVIRFEQPVVGILCTGSHLFESDSLFGVPSVFYPSSANQFRGLEPSGGQTGKGRNRPAWQPDEIILSHDRRTIAIRALSNTEKGYDQMRILTLSP